MRRNKKNTKAIMKAILILLTFLLSGCLIDDPRGPKSWTISGKVSPAEDIEANFASTKIKVGAFSYNSPSYVPNKADITPDIGISTVGADSSFSLSINSDATTTEFIHLKIWFDEDADGKLDADSEPHSSLTEDGIFGGQTVVYSYDDRRDSWLVQYDQENSGDASGLVFTLPLNLLGSSIQWITRGKIIPTEGFVLNLADSSAMIGAFADDNTTISPKNIATQNQDGSGYVDQNHEVTPEAGYAMINLDSTFAIDVNVSEIEAAYLHLIIWHDLDKNKKLDAINENYAIVKFSIDDGSIAYKNDRIKNEWVDIVNEKPAIVSDSFEITLQHSIVPLVRTWDISGKLIPGEDYTIVYSDTLIKIGAFESSVTNFVGTTSQFTPDLGLATVNPDSTFTLSVDADSTDETYIHILTWYDVDNNDTLDSDTEPYLVVQREFDRDGTAFDADLVYEYNTLEKIWGIVNTSEKAESYDSTTVSVNRNLIGEKYKWNISGKFAMSEGYDIRLDEGLAKVGFFSDNSVFYFPDFDDTPPDVISATIQPDSSFSVDVDASEFLGNYLHMIVWYDADGDTLLDALSEPYIKPYRPSLSESAYLFYSYNGVKNEFQFADSEMLAKDTAGIVLNINRNIIPFRNTWELTGKIKDLNGQIINFDSNTVMIGAFPYDSPAYSNSLDDIEPLSGVSKVLPDSSFTLSVNTLPAVDNKYIHIIVWYDTDKDSLLDIASSENFSEPLESTTFGGQGAYYVYEDITLQWEIHYNDKPAKSDTLLLEITTDIVE